MRGFHAWYHMTLWWHGLLRSLEKTKNIILLPPQHLWLPNLAEWCSWEPLRSSFSWSHVTLKSLGLARSRDHEACLDISERFNEKLKGCSLVFNESCSTIFIRECLYRSLFFNKVSSFSKTEKKTKTKKMRLGYLKNVFLFQDKNFFATRQGHLFLKSFGYKTFISSNEMSKYPNHPFWKWNFEIKLLLVLQQLQLLTL